MGFKIELPKRIKNKWFLAEVYEVTIRQFIRLKNPDQKTILGGNLKGLYILVFLPYFCLAYILVAIYILILRLLGKKPTEE